VDSRAGLNAVSKTEIPSPRRDSRPWNNPKIELYVTGKRKWSAIVDCRRSNEVAVGDHYPLSLMEEIPDIVGKAKHFTTSGGASGFSRSRLGRRVRKKQPLAPPQVL
jgi:hypothetical protein